MAHTTRADLLENVKAYLAKAIAERGGPGSAEFAAWEEFFELYNEILRRFAVSLRLPDDEADDLVQEVWGDVIRLLPKFEYDRAKGGFRRWLYRIVKSKAIDAARRRRVRRIKRSSSEHVTAILDELPDPKAADPADELQKSFEFELVEVAVERLRAQATEAEFDIFRLCEREGMPRHEAAERLGLTPDAARASLYRARKRFRAILEHLVGNTTTETAG
jgi:RNA polymerase sigma-70 factor (ECF subfamily)